MARAWLDLSPQPLHAQNPDPIATGLPGDSGGLPHEALMPSTQPIVILGVSSSGTKLLSQIIGRLPNIALITEHGGKPHTIPEDKSPEEDSKLWWDHFAFPSGRDAKNLPFCEEPLPDPATEKWLRDYYVDFANGRRLAVKNPQSLARLPVLQRVIPNAFYVWAARDPKEIINSVLRKNGRKYAKHTWRERLLGLHRQRAILHTNDMRFIPRSNLTARAAHGVGRMASAYWLLGGHIVRYEDLVANPKPSISALYKALGYDVEPDASTVALPKAQPTPVNLIRPAKQQDYIDYCTMLYQETFGYSGS
jgi:hypothetical protein